VSLSRPGLATGQIGQMPDGPAAGLALKDCIEGRKKLPEKALKAEEEDHC
jgi:hypothetical protein